MNFGDRDKMLEMAEKRLKELKAVYPKAQLLNAESVRTVFLVIDDPKNYWKHAAENDVGITRIAAIMKKLIRPLESFSHQVKIQKDLLRGLAETLISLLIND
jgi:formate dehydrogenase iron-sulfur subunit